MHVMRKTAGMLVLAVFLALIAAPVFAHSGTGGDLAPNINVSTTDPDLISWGVLQDHENNMQ